jgi:iron(III) transport system substrate-binding protein
MQKVLSVLALTALSAHAATDAKALKSITVYSARAENLIKPVFDAYTRETGVEVRFVTDKEGPLMERLKAEGANSPADLFLTVDAGNLWWAAKEGLLQPVKTKALAAQVPAHLRDPEGRWYGLSVRARTIFYNPTLVKPEELSTYEDLASAKWKGRLCLRTSKKVYNQSLVAMMIAEEGEKKTEETVKGWVANLAAEPFPDDTKLLEAISAGQCAVGVANTYYYGRLMKEKPDTRVAIFWPNQKSPGGVHVNVSGAGVAKHAKNKDEAVRFLEWASGTKAQNLFVDANLEYPANAKIKPAARVEAWGPFKAATFNVAKAGELQADAVKLMDRAGYR